MYNLNRYLFTCKNCFFTKCSKLTENNSLKPAYGLRTRHRRRVIIKNRWVINWVGRFSFLITIVRASPVTMSRSL